MSQAICALCGESLSHKADVRDGLRKGNTVLVALTVFAGEPDEDEYERRNQETEETTKRLLADGWVPVLLGWRCIAGE